jgi:hypothetical protein
MVERITSQPQTEKSLAIQPANHLISKLFNKPSQAIGLRRIKGYSAALAFTAANRQTVGEV